MRLYAKRATDISDKTIMNEALIGFNCLNHLGGFAIVDSFWKDENGLDCLTSVEVPGITLTEYIRLHKGVGLANILSQVCDTLQKAYSYCEFYHMDLHSDNIIVLSDGKPTILDYGESSCRYMGVLIGSKVKLDRDNALYQVRPAAYPVRDMYYLSTQVANELEEFLVPYALCMLQETSSCDTVADLMD